MGILRGTQQQQAAKATRAEFLASPVGRARTAFERGDLVLQLELDPANQRLAIIPTNTAGVTLTSSDPTEILNAVCREGWEIVAASMAPADQGQRRPGGTGAPAHGYYLFRRAPQHRGLLPAPTEPRE